MRLLLCVALTFGSIYGEIEQITVKWAQGYCLKQCEENLRTKLRTVQQIAEYSVPAGSAQALIRWKPKVKFSYLTLNTIIKGLGGIHIDQVYIKVRGVIEHDARYPYLVSIGDDTRFILLSPINVSQQASQSVVPHNVDSYKIQPQLKQKLIQYENEYRVVTIQGTLLDPWRYVDLYLIVQSATANPPFKQ